ncbi:uncharacterized protein DUF1266 [Allonocardiopsis opalescens]|uniref:Uncharacterized protein DUF1266 n=1 Tax=Allonocardiopsis opalescens TaxID=1144618 RepID=A0A2T0PXP8_9ACTN|nr:uncharacterized protein DUF1266 [Allonocardiopsis opalescens]
MVEEQLYHARARGDLGGYLSVLAGAELYMPIRKDEADQVVSGHRTGYNRVTRAEGPYTVMDVYTRGYLPEATYGPNALVYDMCTVKWVGEGWPEYEWWLVVNPGTPVETRFRSVELAAWVRANAHRVRPLADHGNRLVTVRTGHLYGPMAHALAFGAPLAVLNEAPWNVLRTTFTSYVTDVTVLRDDWGVSSREEWQAVMASLLDDKAGVPGASAVLDLRDGLVRQWGRPVDERTLRDALVEWCRAERLPYERKQQYLVVADLILRYEERFRADGLLLPNAYVRSVHGWDYGRAVSVARWGLAAQLCDRATAEQLVLRAGALCHARYTSWLDFSAGYVLGRMLHFDNGEFGERYTDSLLAHRLLVDEAESPWRHIAY